MIIPVNNICYSSKYNRSNKVRQNNTLTENTAKEIKKTEKVIPINIQSIGNVTKISFKGQFADPTYPSIQFKIRGVSEHQKDFGSQLLNGKDRNVERLADSDWYDGKPLSFSIDKSREGERILIRDPEFGEIGRVPDEIAPSVAKLISLSPNDFSIQLSNIVAGRTKGAPTIGLRANLLYTGTDPKIKESAEATFDTLLNSPNKDITDVIMVYQPKTTPKEILQRIFSNVEEKEGEQAAFKVLDIIDTISDEITNPNNKNILLLGHTGPDGDTIGCVLGLHAAIKANYPEKNVICSIDDKLPGIFRDKLPGIHNISHPNDPNTISKLKEELKQVKEQPKSFVTRNQIRSIEKQLKMLERSSLIAGTDGSSEGIPAKYDLVILMDVPSPSKFTSSYKKEIEEAGKVIYIDHHRPRFEEWDAQKAVTGINMNQVKANNLALVIPELPAATELVTVIADNAGLLDKTMKNIEYAKQFVAGIVSGTSSDTGGFARTANYKPSDMSKPVQERPNYLPEGLSKWLIDKLGNVVDKKWLRENIVYDLPDKSGSALGDSPRQKMVNYSLESQTIFPETGLGIIGIDYEQMYDIWETSRLFDRNITFGDVQNSIKYSEVMGALREAPSIKTKSSTIEPYASPYQDDKISILLIQDKKEGRPTEKGEIATENSIRMSFRSQEGTVYSEMLASLFNGGGHGSAAGGRITLKGVEIDSPISIKIDGKEEYDTSKIYQAMTKNYKVKSDTKLSTEEIASKIHKFETVIDEKGLPIKELLNRIVGEIRLNSHLG